MLRRVADSTYRLHRSLERADAIARWVMVHLDRQLDTPAEPPPWEPLITASGSRPYFDRQAGNHEANAAALQGLIFDRNNPNSIRASVQTAREAAQSIHESLPPELWEPLNALHLRLQKAEGLVAYETLWPLMADVKLTGDAITGVIANLMPRTAGWHTAQLGRLLERARHTVNLLAASGPPLMPASEAPNILSDRQGVALLKYAGAYSAYRRAHQRIQVAQVLDYLLLDAACPRSLAFCLSAAQTSYQAISAPPEKTPLNGGKLAQAIAELNSQTAEQRLQAGLQKSLLTLQQQLEALEDPAWLLA